MSMRQIIVLGVALLAAVAALFLVRGMAGRDSEPKEEAAVVTAGIPVLVAARPLSQGDKATPGDLAWANFPQETLSPNFIQQASTPKALEEFTNAVARFNIEQGEPITATKLVKPGDQSFMAAMLTPGYRAVAVPISAETAVSGFIMPNDRVDIIVTRRVQVQAGERSREDVQSSVILENVRVLAIDHTYRTPVQDKQPTPITGGVATVELSQEDSGTLTAANKAGTISLVLRGVENEAVAAVSAKRRQRDNATIVVHKFGAMSEAVAPSSAGGAQ